MHSPLDYRHKWNPMGDVPLFDDVPALAAIHGPSSSHPTTPGLESDMMNMLIHNSFNEFLDPSIDPASLGPLTPSYQLEQCSPSVMLSDSVDPWSINQYPYLDMSPHGSGPLLEGPPQLTPNMSSSGESSVNSTPQLGHPHFGVGRFGTQMHEQPHVAANFANGMVPYMHQSIDGGLNISSIISGLTGSS